jgi:hypothetical protein
MDYARLLADNGCAVGHIEGDHSICAYRHIVANSQWTKDARPGTRIKPVADDHWSKFGVPDRYVVEDECVIAATQSR